MTRQVIRPSAGRQRRRAGIIGATIAATALILSGLRDPRDGGRRRADRQRRLRERPRRLVHQQRQRDRRRRALDRRRRVLRLFGGPHDGTHDDRVRSDAGPQRQAAGGQDLQPQGAGQVRQREQPRDQAVLRDDALRRRDLHQPRKRDAGARPVGLRERHLHDSRDAERRDDAPLHRDAVDGDPFGRPQHPPHGLHGRRRLADRGGPAAARIEDDRGGRQAAR